MIWRAGFPAHVSSRSRVAITSCCRMTRRGRGSTFISRRYIARVNASPPQRRWALSRGWSNTWHPFREAWKALPAGAVGRWCATLAVGFAVCAGFVAALGLSGVGLEVPWSVQMGFMVVLGFGFFLLHNSVQTEVTELAPSARASAFSLHAFSFFMGQALGPMVYGVTLPIFGATTSFVLGAAILAATGVTASRLLRPSLRQTRVVSRV